MSASGQYQTALEDENDEGYIYVSTDFGSTWLKKDSQYRIWQYVSMSASGQYQTAIFRNPDSVYLSADFGNTWTTKFEIIGRDFTSVAVSASGQYQVICESNQQSNGNTNVYASNDFGNNWNVLLLNTTQSLNSIAISGSGQYVTVCSDKIIYSFNSSTDLSMYKYFSENPTDKTLTEAYSILYSNNFDLKLDALYEFFIAGYVTNTTPVPETLTTISLGFYKDITLFTDDKNFFNIIKIDRIGQVLKNFFTSKSIFRMTSRQVTDKTNANIVTSICTSYNSDTSVTDTGTESLIQEVIGPQSIDSIQILAKTSSNTIGTTPSTKLNIFNYYIRRIA